MQKDLREIKQVALAGSLRNCELFAGLPGSDLEAIAGFAVVKQIDKGDYLFREGSSSEGFYVVQRGAINVHRVNASGKEQVIHVFRPGESFAEASLASESGYPADARALEPSSIILVPKRDFLELLRSRPDLALRMVSSMSQHLRVLVGLLDDLTLKDVETRLANWIINRCPKPICDLPQSIELGMPKRILAAEIGTTSETLSRTLAKFREQKLISVRGKTIQVRSPLALRQVLLRNLGENVRG